LTGTYHLHAGTEPSLPPRLQAIKDEAATASARKVLLEAELKALLEEQHDDDILPGNMESTVAVAEVH